MEHVYKLKCIRMYETMYHNVGYLVVFEKRQ